MTIAILGLGRMGMQIARRLHKKGFEVLAWNRGQQPVDEFNRFIKSFIQDRVPLRQSSHAWGGEEGIKTLIAATGQSPRVFWLMLPHTIVDDFLQNQLLAFLKAGDIVIDGGNSFYKDSIKRAERLKAKGVAFFDCGTSGGVWGEENGFALMVGGPKEQWSKVEPIFKALSAKENYGLVGDSGAGHFVKMVHNGIEYGMMEAIAEGYAVLKASQFNLDLAQVTKIYQQGSVIRSWLIDLMRNIFEQEDVEATKGLIEATGEGEWTVQAGKELGVDVRVIEDALKVRQESSETKNQNKFSNKLVALLRKQFGGHEVKKK